MVDVLYKDEFIPIALKEIINVKAVMLSLDEFINGKLADFTQIVNDKGGDIVLEIHDELVIHNADGNGGDIGVAHLLHNPSPREMNSLGL